VRTCLNSWAAFESDRPVMSWMNVGEVAYLLERRHGAEEAARVVRQLRAAVALDAVTPERVLAAAHIKAQHPIAFADCFAGCLRFIPSDPPANICSCVS
jgi:hypothetical protein